MPTAHLAALLASWPPPTAIERRAFEGQFSDAKCSALGRETKSAGVYAEAIAWANTIDGALRRGFPELRRYAPARFAWFLRCIAELSAAREENRGDVDHARTAKRVLDEALLHADTAARDLAHVLELLAGELDVELHKLSAARAKVDSPRGQLASLNALIDLAADWLARGGDEPRALVAACGLTEGDLAEARARRDGLADALNDAWKRVERRDSASVNRVEGRVLLEMRVALRVFTEAHTRNALVPPLVPGPATKRALKGNHPAKAPPEGAAPPTPPAEVPPIEPDAPTKESTTKKRAAIAPSKKPKPPHRRRGR